MALNPYATHLGTQNPRAVLAATPGLVHQALCAMTPEQIATPIAPGKWSPCQIAAHLADCETVFCFRLRQTLAPGSGEPIAAIQPFDQDAWAARYAAYDVPTALELFRAARAWNLKFLASISDADYTREVTHPERGTMTFRTLVETIAGHDLNHLAQLQRIAGQ